MQGVINVAIYIALAEVSSSLYCMCTRKVFRLLFEIRLLFFAARNSLVVCSVTVHYDIQYNCSTEGLYNGELETDCRVDIGTRKPKYSCTQNFVFFLQ